MLSPDGFSVHTEADHMGGMDAGSVEQMRLELLSNSTEKLVLKMGTICLRFPNIISHKYIMHLDQMQTYRVSQ